MPDPAAPGASRGRVALAFAAVYILWGSTYIAIRFGVETIPPFLMAGTRHLTAGLILYAAMRMRGVARPQPRHWGSAAAVGALMLLGGNGLVTWAEQRVPSGLAALIVASVPIWISVLDSAQRRRRPSAPVIVGLLLGLAGIALLVVPARLGDSEHVDFWGAMALIFAACSWSFGSLLGRRAALPSSTLLATSMEMIAGGASLWVVGLAFGEGAQLHWSAVSAKSLISLAYLIVFGSLVGFTAYVWLLKVTTPARASTYAYVNPVVAIVLGALLAGEVVTLRISLATLVIVGAVALIITARSRPTEQLNAPAVEPLPSRVAAGSGGGSS